MLPPLKYSSLQLIWTEARKVEQVFIESITQNDFLTSFLCNKDTVTSYLSLG
jgi:hypothetical protein